jgi:hypothetical protein
VPGPPHYRGFTITLRHTKFGRTPWMGDRPVERTSTLQHIKPHKGKTSMPPAGFEPAIPAIERQQTARGWVVNVTPRSLYPHERDQVPIVDEAGWTPVPGGMGVGNLAATGIRPPDRPTCSRPQYRLSYHSSFFIYT